MWSVLRFPVKFHTGFQLHIPVKSRPLRVDWWKGHLSIWILCPIPVGKQSLPMENRHFRIAATGEDFDDNVEYVGSFVPTSEEIYHVFEVKGFDYD